MILFAYAVFDVKSATYGQPMFFISEGAAIRAFADVADESSSLICKHPEDFSLYEVGSFDDQTGLFTVRQEPLFKVKAAALPGKPVEVEFPDPE